jgi:hypothetical protein
LEFWAVYCPIAYFRPVSPSARYALIFVMADGHQPGGRNWVRTSDPSLVRRAQAVARHCLPACTGTVVPRPLGVAHHVVTASDPCHLEPGPL